MKLHATRMEHLFTWDAFMNFRLDFFPALFPACYCLRLEKVLEKRLDKDKREPKQMWRLLKEMLKGTSHNREYKELQCGNRINNNMKEMADEFNKYFIDSITEIAAANGDLPIGNEHAIGVVEQFDTMHECDLRNMVGKLVIRLTE